MSDAQPEDMPRGEMDIKVGRDINAGKVEINQYFAELQRAAARVFTAKEGVPFTNEQQEELAKLFVGDEQAIDRLAEELDRCRVLLLTGERAAGKMTTALYICTKLAQREKNLERPLLVTALDQNVPVDVRRIAGARDDFGRRATVFVDAFEHQNRALLTFFSRSEGIGWEQLADTLRTNGAYLIFTAFRSDIAPFRQRIAGHIAQHELAPLAPTHVAEALGRRLARMFEKRPECTSRLHELSEHRAAIVNALESLDVIIPFVEEFVGAQDDVATALRKYKNVDEWFRASVRSDFDAWCSVLTLTLAQPTPDATAISWVDFELLRRALVERIKTDDELFHKPDDNGSATSQSALLSFDDKPLLESSRAVIAKDPERLGDVVRFRDPAYAPELWRTLLTHYRRVLTHLVPTLREIAEGEHPVGGSSLRMLAARVIGRIGEIDPWRISLPLIHRWASSKNRNQRPLVGQLVQGALSGCNPVCRQAALDEIARLADRDEAFSEAAAQDRLVTAISAYSQIGVYEPELAMDSLGAIAIERLAPAIATIHEIWRSADTAERRAEEAKHPRVAIGLYRQRARLARIVNELNDEQAAALLALEMAIVQLSLRSDPIEVLSAMRNWIARGGSQTGVLLAVLFLQDIALELHALSVLIPETNARVVISPMLVSLGSGRNSVANLAGFLTDLWAAITTASKTYTLPADLQRELRETFTSLLTMWARDAADTPFRSSVVDLFAALALGRGEMLRAEIEGLMRSAPFREGDVMQLFAADVRELLN